jgi:hypothetical protein
MNVGMYLSVPEELRLLPNWLLWRLEYPNGPDKKPSKVPYQINGFKASVTNSNHWVTFEVAFSQLSLGGYDGLGFVFTNTDYSGIDLDDASTLADGSPNPNYQADLNRQIKIAHEFDSYSETSPSGKGLHIIVKGKVADGKRTNYIELYPSGRFFTMTGQVHNNKPIKECQELLTLLWSQMGGVLNSTPAIASQAEAQSDEEILNLARTHNASTFIDLEAGIWIGSYPSQSEADQAYLNIVAYYTNNKAQVERIFRKSKLMRDKVNTNKKYLPRSINTAFDQKVNLVNLEGLKNQFDAASSNGKTAAFDAENGGSTPSAVANGSVAQRLEPSPHKTSDVGSNPTASTIIPPPGLMGEIASFIYASSPRPVPEVSLAAAIGLMAGICGRAYNISGTGLNQYVLLLAMTGAGKEAMAEGIDRLMAEIKMQVPTSTTFIGPSEISSGSALFKYLGNTSQSFVSLLGEFGLRIKQLSAPNANGAEVSLRRMILDLYNKSGNNRTLAASAYSKKEDSTNSVPSPSFSILGESTPEKFYEVLNEDMISEGLLPRFLLIEYKGGRVPNNENRSNVAPTISLITKLAALTAQCESVNHSNPRRVMNVQADEAAAKFLYDFDKLADAKINGADKDVIRQLWNRAHIKVMKLAALVAVGENMIEPIINIHTVNWAADLVKNDISTITARFEAGEIGGNTYELNQSKDITKAIREYVERDFDYVKKYGAVQKMHKDKIITSTYLSLKLSKIASFRNDRLGATAALKRSIQTLIDNGKLIAVSSIELSSKYDTTQKSYYVHPSILDQ